MPGGGPCSPVRTLILVPPVRAKLASWCLKTWYRMSHVLDGHTLGLQAPSPLPPMHACAASDEDWHPVGQSASHVIACVGSDGADLDKCGMKKVQNDGENGPE